MENLFDFLFLLLFFYGGAGITILMSFSDGSDPYFFRQKMEKTRSMKQEMDGEVFSPPELAFIVYRDYTQSTFLFCTLNWRVNYLVSRQGKVISKRNESIFVII